MKFLPERLLKDYLPGLAMDAGALRDALDDMGIEIKKAEARAEGLVFTAEHLANRGDLHCYWGIAREIAARTGAELRPPALQPAPDGAGTGHPTVRIASPACLAYSLTCMEVDGIRAAALADALTPPLSAADINLISPIVDLTNFVNLELGQPLHAFDLDKIQGNVIVREAVEGEKAHLLFQAEPVNLPRGALVIADDVKVLAVAGVIGCQGSEVSEGTRRIALESALFDPVSVRVTSQKLKLKTAAAIRFERGGDLDAVRAGTARFLYLLESCARVKHLGGMSLTGGQHARDRIRLDWAELESFFGRPFEKDLVLRQLKAYGFGWEEARVDSPGLDVAVPWHRVWDVKNRWDLFEEVARATSYNELPSDMLRIQVPAQPRRGLDVKAAVNEVLTGLGFFEVITDGFYGSMLMEKLGVGQDHPLRDHIRTLNAIDANFSLLKNNSLGQAMEVLEGNLNQGMERIGIYEHARLFKRGADGAPRELPVLWGLAAGADRSWQGVAGPRDFWFMRGVIEELGRALGKGFGFRACQGHDLASLLHPGRTCEITLDGEAVGIMGEVHPAVADRFRAKALRPVFFELAAMALQSEPTEMSLKPPPSLQPIRRNVSFNIPLQMPTALVVDFVNVLGEPLLQDIAVVDSFFDLKQGVRSFTFELKFHNDQASASAAKINELVESIAGRVVEKFGVGRR